MPKSKKTGSRWLNQPQAHDYDAALSYLTLIYEKGTAKGVVKKLKSAGLSNFQAKDIFRASGLPLLGASDSHVLKDQSILKSKGKLSPLLLVRDSTHGKVVIADGYHRLCAVYSMDEDAVVPCKIV